MDGKHSLEPRDFLPLPIKVSSWSPSAVSPSSSITEDAVTFKMPTSHQLLRSLIFPPPSATSILGNTLRKVFFSYEAQRKVEDYLPVG
jgi:hypothetical protein